MTRVIVSGAIANKSSNGGEAWVRLNWLLGFKRLGCEVFFVEELDAAGHGDGAAGETIWEDSPAVCYFQQVVRQFGLEGSAALISDTGQRIWGLSEGELRAIAEESDVLINISGHLKWVPLTDRIPIKVYVDLDPGFTQFWHAEGNLGARLDGHDYYYTVGENIGAADCPIPTSGLAWRPVRQPVVLDEWPVVESEPPRRFTTIGSWRGAFGPVQVGEKTYGLKVHEFRKFIELPRLVDSPFEIALDIHPSEEKDLRMLRENGWRLVDPKEAAGDPMRFREYVQRSAAEFSVAQGMYVDTSSGWFSDRTARYLASGKPALVQDTGFSRHLPVGEGLLAFRTLDEAVAGANAIAADYDRHSWAARRIAEEYFDSDKVLSELLEQIGVQGVVVV
jgi:hypothetical protein